VARIALTEGGRIRVSETLFEQADLLRSVPGGRWSREQRAWLFPGTPLVAVALLRVLPNAVHEKAVYILSMQAQTMRAAQHHKTAKHLAPVPAAKLVPWHHQTQAFWWAHDLKTAMLALDMGTGKSAVVVWLVAALQLRRVLIVCPVSVLDVWEEQFEKHHPGPTPTVVTLRGSDGSVTKRQKQAQRALERARVTHESLVIVTNHEAVWREPFGHFACSLEWDLIVVDESHRGKAPSGRFSLYLNRLREHAARRLCLTGTPMPHSPLDIYAQFRFLDPGVFGTSFVRFRMRYAIMGGYGNHQLLGFVNQDELAEKIDTLAFRVGKEVLDLPPVQHLLRRCKLSTEARRVYSDLETQLIAEVQEGTVTAANVLVKLLRLQQVTGGFVRTEDGQEVALGENAKAILLADVLEDLATNEPVVVFARFIRDLENIRREAGAQSRRVAELSGRRNDLALWKRGEADVLAVQIQAGGVGVDMSRAHYCIFYSTGYSLGEYEQACARVHRPGQTRPVVYVHLIASKSVDEAVLEALEEKRDAVENVLARMRKCAR